jgi:transposase
VGDGSSGGEGVLPREEAGLIVLQRESHDMAVFRIALTEDEQRVVNAERDSHPEAPVRRKMLVGWLLHGGLTRKKAAEITGLSRPTVQRYVAAYRTGGLDGLRRWGVRGPVGDLVAHSSVIREALTNRPVRTAAEAAEQIEQLTGLKREPAQIRKFLKTEQGFRWRRTRVILCPPMKDLPDHIREQKHFLDTQLQPRLDEAVAGGRHVFFVDAAHFVFGTFLCCLWSLMRIFVKAASGRQRFNVLGAWNAVTRELLTITNTTVVNTETMCALLRVVAAQGLVGPVTLVLDNARYQRNALVIGFAQELGIELLFLPSYSPNLNLIERLWRFVKRKAVYGRYHPTFAEFRVAVQDVLDRVPTTHAEQLELLMTLNFQELDDVSLLAA